MLFYIVFIPLTIVIMGFSIYLWREDVRKYDEYADHFEYFILAFVVSPIVSFAIAMVIVCIVYILGFWLIPIILVVTSVLVFVYWDYIKEYISRQRGE